MNTRNFPRTGWLAAALCGVILLGGWNGFSTEAETGFQYPPEGYALVEGDILVRNRPIDGFAPAGIFPSESYRYWPGGIVYYRFDDNVRSENRDVTMEAMAEWEAVANVQFRPYPGFGGFFIHIKAGAHNRSEIGMQYGGFGQLLTIFAFFKFTVVHELGHALGFWHEQSRADRDAYIRINYANIKDDMQHNFDTHNDASHYGPYDFDSIMHYGPYDFSKNGWPTIVVLPPYDTVWKNAIGQETHLSAYDKLTMSFLYPKDDWRFVDVARGSLFADGTFLDPMLLVTFAVSDVPSGGTIWVQPGTYPAAGKYSKPVTLKAPLGAVVLQ